MRHGGIHVVVEVKETNCKHTSGQQSGVKNKKHEQPFVVFPNAVIYPPAVVIELPYA